MNGIHSALDSISGFYGVIERIAEKCERTQ